MQYKNDQNMELLILEVAERLFLENGFALTSTTKIAKEAGCNQALVHYYFRTKENLFNIIFEQKFRKFFLSIFEMKNFGELTFCEKLKYIIESHFDLLKKNPKIPALLLNELLRKPEQIRILREKLFPLAEQFFSELNDELQIEIKNGKIRNINIADLIISMVSLNITMFVMLPVAESILQLNEIQKEMMIQHRRTENVDFVLQSLRP
ncbi:MAG: TetR/AcrR family transcriptional regulator [Paludibacter sp.]